MDLKGYKYRLFQDGSVQRTDTGNFLNGYRDQHGYLIYDLWKNNQRKKAKAHRLLAYAFIPNPENKPEVNHIDGNKQNNDLDNLEWVTHKENMNHARENDLWVTKTIASERRFICWAYKHGAKGVDLAKFFKVSPQNICQIVKRQKSIS